MSIKTYLKRGLLYILKGVPQKLIMAQITYLNPNERLKGKKIIITGGGRGLGRAMAEKFLSEGAKVLITGRNEETLKKTASELKCDYLVFDVQNIKQCENIIQKANQILGGLDCLVNNAGISLHEGNILNVSETGFDAQINTNFKGAYFLSQQFIKLLEETKCNKGNILFISSERGFFVDDIPYGLIKAAINSLTQGLSSRFIQKGIRVNAIAPGITTSDMTGFKEQENLYCPFNTQERVYLPKEVAEIACFLLSDASSCISGQILLCDEGRTINKYWQ